jgi:hypothetical protein
LSISDFKPEERQESIEKQEITSKDILCRALEKVAESKIII